MKNIKGIEINPDKCVGCGACEAICSMSHYGAINPKKSRIRVKRNEASNVFVPIIAGPYTEAECNGRYNITIDGKEYGECTFCRVSCPSRDLFKEPDTNIPLKCDMCGEPMPEGGPLCVQWCLWDALTYKPERVEEREKDNKETSLNFVVTASDTDAQNIRRILKDANIKVKSVKTI